MPVDSKQNARPNLVLAICCMSLLLAGMDVTIVNVALPAIQTNLHGPSLICNGCWMLTRW